MAGSSSFQRKTPNSGRLSSLPGVTPSLYTSHLLTSTGVPHLDTLIGGGLPIGSMILLQEDGQGSYANLLLRYFLSEGLVHSHSLLVSQARGRDLVNSLPSVEVKSEDVDKEVVGEEQMKIAWRYQGQANTKGETSTAANKGHTFNLLKTVSKEVVEKEDVTKINLENLQEDCVVGWENSSYCKLIRKIKSKLVEGGFMLEGGAKQDRKVLRIGLSSLSSLGWGRREDIATHLPTFLLALRSLIRSSLSVAVVTVPHHIHSNSILNERLSLCSDFVFELESFDSCESVNPAYKDYHGLVKMHKVPSLGTLTPPLHLTPAVAGQLVFKSRRTQFVVEKFCLPPDLGDRVSRDNKATVKKTDIDF